MSASTYTLEVPATKDTINELIARILRDNAPDARITLKFGTCSLMCDDEAERREFGTRVTAVFAVETLIAARE